jgi:hypothetical protein
MLLLFFYLLSDPSPIRIHFGSEHFYLGLSVDYYEIVTI